MGFGKLEYSDLRKISKYVYFSFLIMQKVCVYAFLVNYYDNLIFVAMTGCLLVRGSMQSSLHGT